MKKLLTLALAVAALFSIVSCEKQDPSKKEEQKIDRAVVHCQLLFDFSRTDALGEKIDFRTTFEYVDVKAICMVNGKEVANESVTSKWSKDIEINSSSKVEFKAIYALKKEVETNLPEKLTADCSAPYKEGILGEETYVTVDFYSGSKLVKTEEIKVSDFSHAGNMLAKEYGLERTLSFLERRSDHSYELTVEL